MDKTNADLMNNGDPLCMHKHIFTKVSDLENDTNTITITCDKCSFKMVVIDDIKMNPQPGPQQDFFYEALMRQHKGKAAQRRTDMASRLGVSPHYDYDYSNRHDAPPHTYTYSGTNMIYSSLLGSAAHRGSINYSNYRSFSPAQTQQELHRSQPKRPTRFASTMRWLLLSIIQLAHWLRLTVPETKSDQTPSMNQAPQPGSAPRTTQDPESQAPQSP